jgi:CTP synthase (UTP-ammonia lyase)
MPKDSELLTSVSKTSTDSEFFSPMPPGYKPGKTKYLFVMGTVMSGLGKGIFSSCLAKLMQDKGLKIAPIKLEGYLNIDSGTLNPFRHGEVFVLDDGMECDMDLGTYERMLNQDLSKANFCTSGQIFSDVLNKERHGDYLGRDVQMIPHVTGEVKLRLRNLALKSNADVVFVEIGGTVGDLENAYFIEAMRELAYEEGPTSSCFVALTYILEPQTLGEQKSKAAQLGIKQLMQLGIQPDIIACRATHAVTDTVRQKISVYSNVPFERVISLPDSTSIYTIPAMLRDRGLDFEVARLLKIEDRINLRSERKAWAQWCDFTDKIERAGKPVNTRENHLPYLGICFGFQMAVIEFARSVCGLKGAHSTEIEHDCIDPVIDYLPEQLKIEGLGGNMRLGGHDIELKPDTLAWRLFGEAKAVRMRFRHRYEVAPRYIETLEKGGLVFSGKAPGQPIMQILELPEHPYFIGTQAHPCLTSRPLRPQPMFVGLVAAALKKRYLQNDFSDPVAVVRSICS